MATVPGPIYAGEADFLPTLMPQLVKLGTNYPDLGLAFDAANDEQAFWDLDVEKYASGNPTLEIEWVADTAITGDVVLEAAIACITPEADTQDITTKALATAQSVTDSHLGTTARRLHRATITITNLDSLAPGDKLKLRVRRLGNSSGSDTMVGDLIIVKMVFKYSDT